jgi:uncharacterized protein (TIGR00288 family)
MTKKTKIAVFIDSENMYSEDYKYIQQEIKRNGSIMIHNVYGDWNDKNVHKWIDISREYGMNKIQCDKISGKNSVDIKICVDIMEYLYTNSNIDIFYLITSDSDYRHVIYKIKECNKKAYCIGNSVSNSLSPVCNKYTRLDILKLNDKNNNPIVVKTEKIDTSINLKKLDDPVIIFINDKDIKKEKGPITTINITKPNKKKRSKEVDKNIKKYWVVITNILSNGKVCNISKLNDKLKFKYPTFDYRNYHKGSFSGFLKKYYKDYIKIYDNYKVKLSLV